MDFLYIVAAKIKPSDIGITEVTDKNLIAGILGTVYWAAGITAVFVIIIAGILYVTSDGDSAKVKRAKDGIFYAVIGLVVVMMAFVITNFVVGRF